MEIKNPDPKILEQVAEILAQNREILKMNSRLLEMIFTAPIIIDGPQIDLDALAGKTA